MNLRAIRNRKLVLLTAVVILTLIAAVGSLPIASYRVG